MDDLSNKSGRIHLDFPPQVQLSDGFDERWNGPDQGVIAAWIRGIELAKEVPELSGSARRGELPILPWKGGVSGPLKTKNKIGSMLYVAAWQGLRNENLDVDLSSTMTLTFVRYGVPVTYTTDLVALGADQ